MMTIVLKLTSNNNYCGGGITQKSALSNLSISQLANYRDRTVGLVCDSALIYPSSLATANNSAIYTNNVRYYTVKNAYYNYMNNYGLLSNLGLQSDIKYTTFKQIVGATNIGIIYDIDKNLKNKNYKNAELLLNSYQPHNLPEINTYTVYGIYIKYLKTDSISAQDSTTLQSIANQNPVTGGQDVYLACNLLKIHPAYNNTSSSKTRKHKNGNNNQSMAGNYIRLYPNPVSDYLLMDISGDYDKVLSYKIFSIDGKLIKSGTIKNKSQNKVNLSSLNKGIYYIKIYKSDLLIQTNKIVKSK